jgi:Trypsin-like peptidase domain
MKSAAGLVLAICILPAALYAQAIAYDYSKLYETVSPAVVQVMTDDGLGSGFLVTPFGHVATNYHVIRHSRYLAVQFPDGRKVKAVVAAVNPRYDMAVLKVNSEVVEGIKPLRVLPEERDQAVKVGIPVVAIGSPLNQKFLMTQGILSKVGNDIVLGDFLLQPGNSGGPLMNADGEVVAITTFGEGNIGGAIRISSLRDFLSSPELLAESIDTEPPSEQLRSVSSVRYPIDVLVQKIETEGLDLNAYRFKAGDFIVTTITPVFIAKIQAAHEKRHVANRDQKTGNSAQNSDDNTDEPYYEWHRSTEASLDYAVTFDIRPASAPAKRSVVSRLVPPMLRSRQPGKTQMEFKGEFLEFRLYRDGELLEPIMPGRQVLGTDDDDKNHRFVDQAYAGHYIYSPEEFMRGKEFRMQIIDARNPDVIHKEIIFTADSKLIQQVRADFSVAPGVLITQAP